MRTVNQPATWVIAIALVATVLVYWIGLRGPFLLDDEVNLAVINSWLTGDTTWQHALLSNSSGRFGRSVSMASLMLSAWMGGYSPWAFKLGNLAVHLLCGLAAWQVMKLVLSRDVHLSRHASLVAAALASIWLLHPINASTVLYAVQRMAQMSTLFVLLSLWAYLGSRTAMQAGQPRRSMLLLLVLFPTLVGAGLLSKENAAIAPILCLLFELAYFRKSPLHKSITRTMLALILGAAALAVFWKPGLTRILSDYSGRDFTLWERLLTQSRALMDYLGLIILPRTPQMGVYTDDFVISTGLLTPISTLLAILGLTAVTGFTVTLRRTAPSVLVGWLFFLLAHSVESSFLPLELYFEHRNYLPSFGILIASAGLFEWATRRLDLGAIQRPKLAAILVAAFIAAFLFSTHGRARVWADEGSLLTQAVRTHPDSVRANLALATFSALRGDAGTAQTSIQQMLDSSNPRTRHLGYINRITVDCLTGKQPRIADLHATKQTAMPFITYAEMYAFENMVAVAKQLGCDPITPRTVADTIASVLDSTTGQPDSAPPHWRLRFLAAQLYSAAGEEKVALQQAKRAWTRNADPPIGAFLARATAISGQTSEAESIYLEVLERVSPYDTNGRMGVKELRAFLDSYKSKNAKGSDESPE